MRAMIRNRINVGACVVLATAIAVTGTGCGVNIRHKVGDAIVAALPKVIGPADSYSVDVDGATDSMLRGHIPEVRIHGTNVRLAPEIQMATLDIDAQQIAVDTSTKQLKSIKSLTFSGTMNQAQVDRYINLTDDPNRPPDLAIRLYDHDLRAKFRYKELGLALPVTVAGRLALDRGNDAMIDFIPSSAIAAKMHVPHRVLMYAVKSVNPVIDLTGISFPVRLRQVGISSHIATFSGSAQLPPSALAEGRKVASGQ